MIQPVTEYYKEKLEQGLEYQDFVAVELIEQLGIPLSFFGSRKYQYNKGENKQGIEIKYDDRLKETGNLYIEVAEKANPNNKQYVESGILRKDNTWLYLIGDYTDIYILDIKMLRRMHLSNKYKYVKTPTSKGFLLNRKIAEEWAINVLRCNNLGGV